MSELRRIGLIVPSSNTTIETELPEMLARQGQVTGTRFTFHSSRAVLQEVDAESLDRMVGQVDRCVRELADARVDAIAYACLVALMARGGGAHEEIERQIQRVAGEVSGYEPAIVSSASALVRACKSLGLRRIAILTPYVEALTELVVRYLEAYGLSVVDAISLRVSDNLAVGRLDPRRLPELAEQLDTSAADGVVISACVQMPSLAAIPEAERRLGLPVLSAATATVWDLLRQLRIEPSVLGGGALLGARSEDDGVGGCRGRPDMSEARMSNAITPPAWRALPPGRRFAQEFLELRALIYARLEHYYDRDHLTRAGDWMLALAPDAPEYLVLAALSHDLERDVPGGPLLDKASTPWDDETYNRAHCERSAEIVSSWLAELGASPEIVCGVRKPIREHEFGGSPEGDLMQAADSISFLETNADLVAGWVLGGECSLDKGRQKLRWMQERVRLAEARGIALHYFERATAEVDRQLLVNGRGIEVAS